MVTSTLEAHHSVLLPCDPSPRLLELLVLLDQHWAFKLNPLANRNQMGPPDQTWPYPLCLVSRTAQDMLAFARSLVEWMGGVIKNSGAEDVVVAPTEGKKRRAKRQLVAEGDMALEFKYVLIECYTRLTCKGMSGFSPALWISSKRTLQCDRKSYWLYLLPCLTVRQDGCLPPWPAHRAMWFSSLPEEKTTHWLGICTKGGRPSRKKLPDGGKVGLDIPPRLQPNSHLRSVESRK